DKFRRIKDFHQTEPRVHAEISWCSREKRPWSNSFAVFRLGQNGIALDLVGDQAPPGSGYGSGLIQAEIVLQLVRNRKIWTDVLLPALYNGAEGSTFDECDARRDRRLRLPTARLLLQR
ncbi:MAG: hypothetical protein SFX72_21800, partial [Isosphaeraceae bacterium]|nr:hypothetical protein [Isosphaeraceae bacterium]